jgi:hypothetical protein
MSEIKMYLQIPGAALSLLTNPYLELTWFVTSEIRPKIQTFVNRCPGYILRNWWPKTTSNKDLRKEAVQEDANLELRNENLDGLVTH